SLITRAFGRIAETEAERYLRRKGYRILERNERSPHGELDLVVQLGDLLVFVEVKARRTSAYGGAPHAVDGRKQAKLVKLAAQYLARHNLHNQACRFDVVLCTEDSAGRLAVEHIEQAFEAPGGTVWSG
ncbi:MAG: YraN family protein, partial [Nitrospiraceae bacterium]